MAGRTAKKVYLYNKEGGFERVFESISDFARTYNVEDNIFSTSDRRWKHEVYEFADGSIAAIYKIGRKGIEEYRRYKNSPYTKHSRGRNIAETVLEKTDRNKFIEVRNLDGELIATFKNSFFLKKLMQLGREPGYKNYTEDGLKFIMSE